MTAPQAEFDTNVRLAVFHAAAGSGSTPSPPELAHQLGTSLTEIDASLDRLAADRVVVLKPGTSDIWMANPFSAVETGFEVSAGNSRWYGNCIWDSLGILALVKREGFVETPCPDCGELLRVDVARGELQPSMGIVHFAVPAAHWWDDIGYT